MARARHRSAHKGRGAVSNPAGRFQANDHAVFDDGWGSAEEEPVAPDTVLRPDPARRLITRNRSPDVPFEASINPYRGCEHGCLYCLDGDTPVLMAAGGYKPIAALKRGDIIIGTRRSGHHRRYVETEVLAHWSSIKPAYRITLADGTQLTASAEHRFLTERGWKHVLNAPPGQRDRAHLTANNKLMGTGAFAAGPAANRAYRLGYLCGLLRGDAHLGSYQYPRAGRHHGNVYRFRLALTDDEALNRAHDYLAGFGVATQPFVYQSASKTGRALNAIRTSAQSNVEAIAGLIRWPQTPDDDWRKGFLAGLVDAEGHYGNATLRISNSNPKIINTLIRSLDAFGYRYRLEPVSRPQHKPLTVVRLLGGICEQLRFFHSIDPAIRRKLSIVDYAVKTAARLQVAEIESLNETKRMYDITTGTGDFIANGVISHNCFARPTHSYLDLSPGLDFESQIFFKENAAEKLENELRKPGYRPSPISLGINTDAYQPAERRLRITRSILEVLLEYRHPVSLLTKSTLIQRDLDLLGAMAERNLVSAAVSITSLTPAIKRSLEPRTASPAGRLKTIRALAETGVPTGVMAAPVIPAITDHELEAILEAAAQAGARSAGYVLLRLPWEVKDLFRDWLAEHYPERADHVMSLVRQSHGGRDYDSSWGTRMTGTGIFAELIAQRFRNACKRHGLNRAGRAALDCSQFRLPPRGGDQLRLL